MFNTIKEFIESYGYDIVKETHPNDDLRVNGVKGYTAYAGYNDEKLDIQVVLDEGIVKLFVMEDGHGVLVDEIEEDAIEKL